MPTLRCHYLLLVSSGEPLPPGPAATEFGLARLPSVPLLPPVADLFGPGASTFAREARRAQAAFAFTGERTVQRGVGNFFEAAATVLGRCVGSSEGWALDVDRLWPVRLSEVKELPEDPLPEDLFSVAFHEQGGDVYRAETMGLSKLDQEEIGFQFQGRHLFDEAELLCAHVADYAMGQPRRVSSGQTMTFGFDRLLFASRVEEPREPSPRARLLSHLRATVAPERQRLLVTSFAPMSSAAVSSLTDVLQRAQTQEEIVEGLGLVGEPPHQTHTLRLCACLTAAAPRECFVAVRDEPEAVIDSGWIFSCGAAHSPSELQVETLGLFVERYPGALRYVALPQGCRVEWRDGEVLVDPGRAQAILEEEDAEAEPR